MPVVGAQDAGSEFEDAFAPGPFQPREPHDLASPQDQVDGGQARARADALEGEDGSGLIDCDPFAPRRRQKLAPDHPGLDAAPVQLAGLEITDLATILQNGEPVGHAFDLGEVMRHEGDGEAARL